MSDDKRVLVVARGDTVRAVTNKRDIDNFPVHGVYSVDVRLNQIIDPAADDFPLPELVIKVDRAITRARMHPMGITPARAAIAAVMEWAVGRG